MNPKSLVKELAYLKENNVRDLDIALEMFTEAEIKQAASKGKIFLQGNRIIL